MRIRFAPALLATALVTQVTLPREAEACSPPLKGVSVSPTPVVPRGGALILGAYCFLGCDSLGDAQYVVRDENGSVVAGAVAESEFVGSSGWAAWQPDAPFDPGDYTFEFSHPEKIQTNGPAAFVVAENVAALPTDFSLEPASGATVTGPSECCQEGPIDTCGGLSCSTIPEAVSPWIQLVLDFEYDENLPAAVVYRSRGGDGDWSNWATSPSAVVRFHEEADEYCYEVEVREPGTEDSEPLFSGCVSASDVPSIDLDGEFELAQQNLFAGCTVPPEGYEDRWCETFAENIRTGSCEGRSTDACEAAIEACPKKSVDPLGSGGASNGTGGSPGAVGGAISAGGPGTGGAAPGHPSAGDAGDEPDINTGDDDRDAGSNVRACSHAPAPGNSNSGWLLFAALGLGALSLRRRAPLLSS